MILETTSGIPFLCIIIPIIFYFYGAIGGERGWRRSILFFVTMIYFEILLASVNMGWI